MTFIGAAVGTNDGVTVGVMVGGREGTVSQLDGHTLSESETFSAVHNDHCSLHSVGSYGDGDRHCDDAA